MALAALLPHSFNVVKVEVQVLLRSKMRCALGTLITVLQGTASTLQLCSTGWYGQ